MSERAPMSAVHRYVATLGLAPLLLAQGLYVRRATPRLPEATGARVGATGQGDPLRVLIVGDSAAAGVGVNDQREALSGHLADALTARLPDACSRPMQLTWQLVAKTGLNTAEFLTHLSTVPDAVFDIAVTSLGVNDVTHNAAPARWLTTQQALVQTLRERFGVRYIVLTSVPPMHLFPALPQPLRWFLGDNAARLNDALRHWSADQPDCDFLAMDWPLDPALMANDGFHPSSAGYAVWAGAVADRIVARIAAILPEHNGR